MCEVCDCQVPVGEKAFTALDELVHRACAPGAQFPCADCWLVHGVQCDREGEALLRLVRE